MLVAERDLLERLRQLITFGAVMHPPSMVLAVLARGCLWSQLVQLPAEQKGSAGLLTGNNP